MPELNGRDFWSEQCPERGAGLTHAHWSHCHPEKGGHPNPEDEAPVIHQFRQCCHCALYAYDEPTTERTNIPVKVVEPDPDALPLALPQPGCGSRHNEFAKTTPLIGNDGLEWPTAPCCGVIIEPKLATGFPHGPPWGSGRGWVSPRIKNKWGAIAYRAMRDREDDVILTRRWE